MPTPNFRLASLLNLRRSERDGRQLALGLAQRAELILRGQIAELDSQMAELRRERIQAAAPGLVRPDLLGEAQQYAASLASRRVELDARHAPLLAEVERCREALVTADRELKVLEKLRDRRLTQHLEEQQRLESRQLDEAATSSFVAGGDCGGDISGEPLGSWRG